MRKRIKELAEGRVACIESAVEFSVSRIEMEVCEGRDFKGEFTITGKNQASVRGLVYSSNSRMECLTEGFEGEEIRIQYKFHSAGLVEGDVQEGKFFIVCAQGEYTLPFVASVVRLYADSQMGAIRSLSDFSELAKNHWQEAKKVFYSPGFLNLLKNCEERERFLHIGLARGVKTDKGLEEFLLAAGRKEEIYIELNRKEFLFSGVKEQIWQDVAITRNTWGYAEYSVDSDADFIVPKKRKLTTEDFLGSEADFGFYIEPENLHAGKNFGRLIFKSVHQEIYAEICAVKENSDGGDSSEGKEIRKLHIEFMQTYLEYRLRKIVTGRWAFLSCHILDSLIALDDSNAWYRLFKAQALWTNGQKQEAEWILNEFKRKHRDKKSPQWGYYMYICTLMDHEELYVDRLTDEIEEIYWENRDHFLLFFCLLFLRKDYAQNGYQKLRALEGRIMGGVKSPLLYVEAYELFCQEPYLMNRLGDFEIEVLNWARKQGMMTKALTDQLISVFPDKMPYRKTVFLLLKECYRLMDRAKEILYENPKESVMTNDKRVLSVICGYLIRNQKYGGEFFSWYAKGVEEKLRITGLYEAYLMSMDARSVLEVPKIIQMYFKYNNQLGSRQKAVLYVNIIAAKKKQPETFRQHYPSMEKFAYAQMEQGHIDDNLAVIYQEVLSHGIYSSQISDALSDVLFVHRLTCTWNNAARVVILQNQMELQNTVPIIDQMAYFPLYSNDYMIFIEDRQGNRYAKSVDYQLEKLMYPGRYLRICMESSPQKLPYLLYYFGERKAQEVFEEKDLEYFRTVMASDEVDWTYKAWLFPKMFFLMHRYHKTGDMKRELDRVDFSLMRPEDRKQALEICLSQRLYGQAFWIAKEYGFSGIPAAARVPFVSDCIYHAGFAEDRTILRFCAETFFDGKYNDIMLQYLNLYYNGPTAYMTEIFERALKFGVSVKEIAERILVQMLYTSSFGKCTEAVYGSFEEGGDKQVKEAYLTYFSHRSFIEGEALPEGFFDDLQKWKEEGNETNELCSLALLSYYAKHSLPPDAEELLQKSLFQGMYFGFYRNFSLEFRIKYQLYDKYYIEYRANGSGRVWLHYQKEGEAEEFTEEMTEVCEGIYVKKIILFAGEAVSYYILEESDGAMEKAKSGRIECGMNSDDAEKAWSKEGRYGMLNRMLSLCAAQDDAGLYEKMREYEQMNRMTENLFSVIK